MIDTNEKKLIWKGRPAQLVNLNEFGLLFGGCLLLVILLGAMALNFPLIKENLIPLILVAPAFAIVRIVWLLLDVFNHDYMVSQTQIIERRGILSRRIDTLELFRVKDLVVMKPFYLRIFGLGNILLYTSDASDSVFQLEALADSESLLQEIRNLVIIERRRHGVREFD